jgi:hypothetical protein
MTMKNFGEHVFNFVARPTDLYRIATPRVEGGLCVAEGKNP